MIRMFPLLWFVSSAAHAAPESGHAGWAVESAPYRVELKATAAPDAADAGWEIRLPDFGAGRPDMRDVVLLGPDQKEIALDGVWRGAGRAMLMLAESMPDAGATATLYFGGTTSRRMKTWAAKRSLLLETRKLAAGSKIATYAGWQEAWRKAPVIDGMAFVPMIFHGDNPFGDPGPFLSRYTGRVKTGDGGDMNFYTLSDDASYVTIDGRSALKWEENQPPSRDPTKVPVAKVRVPKGLASVVYCHASVDAAGAMALGWEKDGKLGTIPAEAWVHPGMVQAGAIESKGGAPVPLPELVAERYLGYGGEWYVSVKGSVADVGDAWQVEWIWPDGQVGKGSEIRRLWMSLEPVRVVVRLRKDGQMIEGRRTLVIPRGMEAASVNNGGQLASFLELLQAEDPSQVSESAGKAAFIVAKDFLPSSEAAKWAEAWLKSAKPEGELWIAAMTMAIRETAKRDPQAALDRLSNLPAPARAAMGREADLMELDLRVFGLKDPMVVGLAAKLEKSGDEVVSRMAKIRLGDYHLLNDRIEDAVRCFAAVLPDDKESGRRAPVVDRSHSLAIENLIQHKHLDEARVKLLHWERQRPAAKIEGDQLYWRARVMFLAGEWNRALQDLETSLRIRPGAPEEIDALFWQGRALYELGRKEEARKIWSSLMKDYPKHERADAAKQWVEKS
jgi:tetratricopeptide (TPR) repeat protein